MKENDMKEILKTIEYLRALTEEGRKEMAHMWNYISTFGFYVFVCSFVGSLFNEWRVWFWALPVAFILSTGPSVGWFRSLFTWIPITGIVVALAYVLKNPMVFVLLVVALVALGFTFLYSKDEKRRMTRKFTLAPKIGVFWGILMGGVAVNIFALAHFYGVNQGALHAILWPFATGVGYLITGFFTSKEFAYLGIVTIFGVPIVFVVNPYWTFLLFGVIGLLIGIVGLRLKFSQAVVGED